MSGGRVHRSLGERLCGGLVFASWVAREHRGYHEYRKEFERTQFLSREALQSLQQERLQRLVQQAAERCPFYRERFAAAGIDPNGVWSPEAWQRLPLLTKRDIQDHGEAMQAREFPENARVRNQTGGSTGSPLQFYVDRRRLASRMASTHRHNAWTGLQPGDWLAQLWGARLDQLPSGGAWNWMRRHLLYRTLDLNTSSIGEGDWETYIALLRHYRPRFLVSYARSAVELAEYLQEHKITDIGFQSIITTAEVLMPAQRALIEQVLGGKVFNRYGCREVSVIASECREHSGMHVNAEALLVEIVPSPELPVPWGKVVVTDLLNDSMPLIRYKIGDVARWAENICACGRGLPMLAEVEGRTTDFLHLPDGRVVSGPALTLVIADLSNVRQVQFVQREREEVILRVVPGRGYDAGARQELQRRLDLYLKGAARLTIEEVDAIPTEVSGKYRFVKSELDPAGRGKAAGGEA